MAKRFNISVNDAVGAAIQAAAGALRDPNDWIRNVLTDHLEGKCAAAHAQGACGAVSPAPTPAPAAAPAHAPEPARGRGRPMGGTIATSKIHDAIMGGTVEEATAELLSCGFFPPGCVETIEGDPKNPAPAFTLMVPHAKDRVHSLRESKVNPKELEYLQLVRTYNVPSDGEISESPRVATATRSELWHMVKNELKSA